MSPYHDLSGLFLLLAVTVAVMAVYLMSGLLGVAVGAALTDVVLRRVEARRMAEAPSARRRNSL